ncbi:hypothetical protein [Stomatohabitans albus]|uniref:hypothetical protein n=1 Tax=Stomatohabitans albus TaxID=3110766 RepID=UPI00300C4717
MDFVYGLDDIATAEEARSRTLLALLPKSEPIELTVGNTLIEIDDEGQPERHLWNVVMGLFRHFRSIDTEPELLGMEGREGPQGLALLSHVDDELYRRLENETAPYHPIVAVFPAVDGLPEDHASTFQTLVLKSGRVGIHIITTVCHAGLLPMLFAQHIKTDDPTGYGGVLVGKHDAPDIAFNAPHFERQDINHFKKSLR